MMRWWWFGPAVTKPEIERELQAMKAGGIGGVEVQPVYPVALDDPGAGIRNLPYLSDEFIEALRFAAEKARELGLRFDLTLGSGWPYGGPQVGAAQAAGKLRIERVPATPQTRRVAAPASARANDSSRRFSKTPISARCRTAPCVYPNVTKGATSASSSPAGRA